MSNEMTQAPGNASPQADGEAVQALMRFWRVIRFRMQYILGALVVVALLGTLYYLTATHVYLGTASVLVTQSSPNVFNASAATNASQRSFIPTYVDLFEEAVVVDNVIKQIKKMPAEMQVDFEGEPDSEWPTVLRDNFEAENKRRTNLIEVSYGAQNPKAAKAIVRAMLDAFMDFVEKHHQNVSVEIVTLLDGERKKVEGQLVQKQADLLDVKHRVRDLGLRQGKEATHPAVQRVVRLNETLVEVQKERLKLQALQAGLHGAIERGEDMRNHLTAVDPVVGRELMMGTLGMNPSLLNAMTATEQRLVEERATLQSWSEQLGPRHPEVIRLTRSIQSGQQFLANYNQSLQDSIGKIHHEKLGRMLHSIVQRRLTEAQTNENNLLQEFAKAEDEAVNQNDRMAELQIAENEVARLRRLHETLLDRISDVDINQSKSDLRVAIVSDAVVSDRPVSPQLKHVVLFCLLGGLACGMVIAYVLDMLDDRFRTPEEVKQQTGVPVLAMVRKLKVCEGQGAESVQVHVEPSAVECEAFRTLRTTLAFTGRDMERLAVTSSEPGDGKTTILSNLATAYAQAGKKTLVIDADLRKPGLTKLFGMRSKGGLSEILRMDDNIQNACVERIRNTGIANLDILPSGPRPSDPAELLSHRRLSGVIAQLEGVYDQILIDCPPIVAASDAALVGREVDGVLLVVRPTENHRRVVIRSIEALRSMNIHLTGIVTNRMESGGTGGGYYGDGYGYGLGYGYGSGYGYGEDDTDDESDAKREDDDDDEIETSVVFPKRKTIAPVRRQVA